MIKAVSFDIGGTLIMHADKTSIRNILSDYYDVPVLLFNAAYRKHFIEKQGTIDNFCKSIGCNNTSELVDIVTSYYMEKPKGVLYDDVADVIEKLADRSLYLLTFSNKSYLNPYCMETYGMEKYFKAEVYSYQIGYSKPDIKAFYKVQKNIDLEPNEIIHIGDSVKSDIIGAKKAGWHTVLIQRSDETKSSNLIRPIEADFIVSNLYQLEQILDNLS